jgi:hypothetical protein
MEQGEVTPAVEESHWGVLLKELGEVNYAVEVPLSVAV